MSYSFLELLKASKKNRLSEISGKSEKIMILADSASQHLKTALSGCGQLENIALEVYDTDYDQIELQIFNTNSELFQIKPDVVVLFLCHQKLYDRFCDSDRREDFADTEFKRILQYHKSIRQSIKAKIIQPLFIEENDSVFGNYGLSVPGSFIYQVKKLNYLLLKEAAKNGDLFLVDASSMAMHMGLGVFLDLGQYNNSKLAYSLEAMAELAQQITGIVKAIGGKIKKCVILDLDNTLWGGVIGDDGLDGIALGELGIGRAFVEFQLWLRELKRRGILLCVCSKNNEDIAKTPFINHPDMVLELSDITMFVANWEDKATNIRRIQETLNLGMDSFVFIDDNPFERNLIRELIPEITVPEMPQDPVMYIEYLKSLNLFETASFSDNDEKRTRQYKEEVERNELKNTVENFNDYLKNLLMEGNVSAFEEFYYPRIAQLTQRSNQFNLRTIRYTEEDIARLAKDTSCLTLYFTLKDRFGDYGLVSVVILKERDEAFFVDTWLMSCRVLKRGMEEFVMNAMVDAAKKNGYSKIIGEYIRTPKNAMVEHLYEDMGFEAIGENQYCLEVESYINKQTFIKKSGGEKDE